MGSVTTVCNRRVRSAAGLGDSFSTNGLGRRVRNSCSTSGSASGSSSDDETELAERARIAAGPVSGNSVPVSEPAEESTSVLHTSGTCLSMYGKAGGRQGYTMHIPASVFEDNDIPSATPEKPRTPERKTGSNLPDAPGSRQSCQSIAKTSGESVLIMSTEEVDDIYLSPDVPLIYVSCISTLVLLYFVLFIDCKAVAKLIFPFAMNDLHWNSLEKLETGLSVGASILLAFFVWLLHALLFDIAGMLAGLIPSIITFSAVFSYRILHLSSGYLVAALIAVACGFAVSRTLEMHLRCRRKLHKAQSNYNR
uniref:Transmembrane protein n=1 Tax=Tetraselmis sp. GSL018 TaxID=582737 RepID=A0A061RIC8_9CHLO|eukprot:CAMPEP_0177579954 /NCGR_PEP_ID=MMETSP0419_2-20121207/1264_1 /TAXON_ID=582737 /ORGANISM="Tetraselmis sp., Strain GSL018" /LENGTH=308 /DNA_ID=CAMNT_0019068713 /DNA_START=322 /DNA_END=1248 /DNA_ORIENTATION=+